MDVSKERKQDAIASFTRCVLTFFALNWKVLEAI